MIAHVQGGLVALLDWQMVLTFSLFYLLVHFFQKPSENKSERHTNHLSEHFVLLVSNANQFLNKTVGEVPAQHVRNQQRRLERAPAVREHTVLNVN